MKQLNLFLNNQASRHATPVDRRVRENQNEWRELNRRSHGGSLSQGVRKRRRPLSVKNWIHLVLKSQHATGRRSLLAARNKIFIDGVLKAKAKKFGIKLKECVNVGNHLHIVIRIGHRANFGKFLKSVTALIARHVTGARRGNPFGRFWEGLAFTRVLSSRLEAYQLQGYMTANRIEASRPGEHGRLNREKWLRHFNRQIWLLKTQPKTKLET